MLLTWPSHVRSDFPILHLEALTSVGVELGTSAVLLAIDSPTQCFHPIHH